MVLGRVCHRPWVLAWPAACGAQLREKQTIAIRAVVSALNKEQRHRTRREARAVIGDPLIRSQDERSKGRTANNRTTGLRRRMNTPRARLSLTQTTVRDRVFRAVKQPNRD